MGEKRKPEFTILLRKQGKEKAAKLELFPRTLWLSEQQKSDNTLGDRYRLRVDGKWWPKGEVLYVTRTRVKELCFRAMFRM